MNSTEGVAWSKQEPNTVTASETDNVYSIVATKVGATAMFTNGPRAGKVYKWSKKGIKSLEGTGTGGILLKNHKPLKVEASSGDGVEEYGIIDGAEVRDGFVFIRARVPEELDAQFRDEMSDDKTFIHDVSIECQITDVNDEDMTLDGGVITGISFTMGNHVSKCTSEDGCGVIASDNEALPSNINEGMKMTEETDYKKKYEEVKAELESLRSERGVIASDALEALKEENARLKTENETVVASKEEISKKYDEVIASIKKSKLEQLRGLVGDEAAKQYEGDDVTVCEIEKAMNIVASFKKKVESEPVVDSGAPAVASSPADIPAPSKADDKESIVKSLFEQFKHN